MAMRTTVKKLDAFGAGLLSVATMVLYVVWNDSTVKYNFHSDSGPSGPSALLSNSLGYSRRLSRR